MAGPLWLSCHVLLPRALAHRYYLWLAEVKSRTTTKRRERKGLGILLHYAKKKQRAEYKTEAKRPKSAESQDQGCVHLLANNCCSFSLEKQKSPQREFSPLEKDAPPCLDRRTPRILMHFQLFLLSFCRSYQHVLPNHTYCMLVREAYSAYAYL